MNADAVLDHWQGHRRLTRRVIEAFSFFSRIPAGRFQETITSFGIYTAPVHWQIFYVIDNEIHHRAQGYVYLRAFGIGPPHFWER